MKVIKIILIVIIVIIAIPLIAALFMKNDYAIVREVVINQPRQQVFDYIKLQKNQNNYNEWYLRDPNAQKDYKGTDGTVGFIIAWDSKNGQLGKGEQEIKAISEGQSVNCEIRFEKPMKNIAATSMVVESVSDNQAKVKWTFSGVNKYPMNVTIPMLDGILGKDLQASLLRLKGILEKQ